MTDSAIKHNHKVVEMWNKKSLTYNAEQTVSSVQMASPQSIFCHTN